MSELRAAIVQDAGTQRVLMLGWMDEEAERRTRETGQVHFFSRSRQRLWRKGETSGNVLEVESMEADCDGDALLVQARPAGPTCHTGTTSCFTPWLWRRIVEREGADPAASYVARLQAGGPPAVAQKVGEEAVETVIAALSESDERLVSEAADLWFHLLVLLRSRNLDVADVEDELRRRSA
ncbi:MAG: bifunctional phosphoribosyl-AMP cyclohydrolase/phosphoribosyl-ATP diphosphatase HisIE [Candidatus Dormibacteraeota bacterium]|nr:bifunctional phosphoribosyl-AMP cyclohydrolase/phosphoribosyl-ATP diphosphatase HisIE [Candidatus Dormibacteraeota bacterium]